MPKVRNIEAVIITREHSNTPTALPAYKTYLDGALSVQAEVNLSGTVSYSSFEQNGQHPEFASLQVRAYPTILFVDDATGVTLIRIEGRRITSESVAQALRTISGWELDTSTGKYLDTDGKEVAPGGNGVFSVLPGEGYNFGIPPIHLPKALWWILTGVGAYYTAGLKNETQQILMGAGTAWAASKALEPAPDSLGFIPPPSLGKITDRTPIKPGSRVDEYWRANLQLDTKIVGNRKTPWIKKLEPSAIISAYKLHSVEFGNWVTQQERYNSLYAIAVSLADLAKAMNVTQSKIGFGKKLAIAYGARGRGGRAAATYHPSYQLINITKPHGDGALAHEYGHAIDYYHSARLGFPPSGGNSLAKRPQERKGGAVPALFEKVFEALYWDDNGRPTGFQEAIKTQTDYWQQRNEVWARTFEAWINLRLKDLKLKNHFLVFPMAYQENVYPRPELIRKAEPFIRQIITKTFGR